MLADLYIQDFCEENGYHRDRQFSNRHISEWPENYDPHFIYHTRRESDLKYQIRMPRLASMLCPEGQFPHVLGLAECQAPEPGAPGDQFGCLLDALRPYCNSLQRTELFPYSEGQQIPCGLMILYDAEVVELMEQEQLTFKNSNTLRALFRMKNESGFIFNVFCHHNSPKSCGGISDWQALVRRLSRVETPYILMGDFNRDSRSGGEKDYIQMDINSLDLYDPWNNDVVPTYAPLIGSLARFDYILLSKHFHVDERWLCTPPGFLGFRGWRARNKLISACGTDHAPLGVTVHWN
jgi:hypothetical protein